MKFNLKDVESFLFELNILRLDKQLFTLVLLDDDDEAKLEEAQVENDVVAKVFNDFDDDSNPFIDDELDLINLMNFFL